MKLWIRSQDRRILQEVDNVSLDSNYGDKRICNYADDYKTELGIYKSKTRALEVLDEIQNIIYINKLFNADINAFKKSLEIEGYTEKEISKALKTISTYEMPKE